MSGLRRRCTPKQDCLAVVAVLPVLLVQVAVGVTGVQASVAC